MDRTQLPNSFEAEQSVLGAILINPECINEVVANLGPQHFYTQVHQEIYAAMYEMFNISKPIDAVTLLDKLKQNSVFNDQEGKEYIFRLAQSVPTSKNVLDYAKIVLEKHVIRSLIEASQEISERCYENSGDAEQIIDFAEQQIYNITRDKNSKGFVKLSTAVISALDKLHKMSSDERENYIGTPTHFRDLDKLIVGLNNSDLILLAARPGMGKTSFALNIAQNVATRENKTVAVFSLEMSTEQLAERMLSSEALVDSQKLRRGELNDADWEKIADAAGILGRANILFDDSSAITVSEMKAKLRKVKNLGLVVIDYLQLMSTGKKSDNRVQEVSEISRSLKIMAKDLNVPVITLSQLSRGPESRTDKRPMLADLRESGAIEQDADIVVFLYRDDYYKEDSDKRNICECIIAKNRHGSTGKVDLQWIGEYTRFANQDKVHNEP